MKYEPDLPKDKFEEWLELQRDNAFKRYNEGATEISENYARFEAFGEALHVYKVIVLGQRPISDEP
jgi:hypothetical protein